MEFPDRADRTAGGAGCILCRNRYDRPMITGQDDPGRKPIVFLARGHQDPAVLASREGRGGGIARHVAGRGAARHAAFAPMPGLGPRCHELRVRDEGHNWRIFYRIDRDAILIIDVTAKKTQRTPKAEIDLCRKRLAAYDRGEGPQSGWMSAVDEAKRKRLEGRAIGSATPRISSGSSPTSGPCSTCGRGCGARSRRRGGGWPDPGRGRQGHGIDPGQGRQGRGGDVARSLGRDDGPHALRGGRFAGRAGTRRGRCGVARGPEASEGGRATEGPQVAHGPPIVLEPAVSRPRR